AQEHPHAQEDPLQGAAHEAGRPGGTGVIEFSFAPFFSSVKRKKVPKKEKLKNINGKYRASHTSHLCFFWVPFLYKEKARIF
ncbi:MAG: hypothetical protein IJI97_03450, partial [Clostridia bacterium]|nr:hypothetical protein [Clostridia bacterium]